jgi:hypothetical protein
MTYFDLAQSEIGGNIKFRNTEGVLKNILDLYAVTKNFTSINGGLVLTTLIKMLVEGVETGGLSANSDNILLWGGGTYEDALAGNVPLVIYHDGRIVAKEGVFSGFLQTPFINLEDSDAVAISSGYRLNKNLNINVRNSGATITLPTDISYSGSIVNILSSKYPPYTYSDMIPMVAVEGGDSIGGTYDPAILFYQRVEKTSLFVAGDVLQLIATPLGDGSKVKWIATNYKYTDTD